MILMIGDGFQALPRRHDLVVRVGFPDLSLWIDFVDGEITGPVEVEVGIELFRIEAVDRSRVLLRDVAVTHEFADNRTILAFG